MMNSCNVSCKICEKINTPSPYLIKEFETSLLFLGPHRYFNGYGVLYLKKHVREIHELPINAQKILFEELMQSGKAISEVFKPWKLNYSCYGNQVEHIHWHIFPRYESDPDHRQHPWFNMNKFSEFPRTPENSQEELLALKKYFTSFDLQNQKPS